MPCNFVHTGNTASPCMPVQSGSYMVPTAFWPNHPLEVSFADSLNSALVQGKMYKGNCFGVSRNNEHTACPRRASATQRDVNCCSQMQSGEEAWVNGVLNLDGGCDAAGCIGSGYSIPSGTSMTMHGYSARPEQLPWSRPTPQPVQAGPPTLQKPSQGSKDAPHPKPPKVCLCSQEQHLSATAHCDGLLALAGLPTVLQALYEDASERLMGRGDTALSLCNATGGILVRVMCAMSVTLHEA